MVKNLSSRLIAVFILAFGANVVWEFLHSALYVHYQGGAITNAILLHAALFDASVITLFAIPMLSLSFLRKRLWIAFVVGVAFATCLEWFALATARWEYTSAMPIIPFIHTGLTPTIQLGLIAWVVYSIVLHYKK
jgi:hypothetical protein